MIRRTFIVMMLASCWALPAGAQFLSLPIATSAEEGTMGAMTTSGGIVVGDELIALGGRLTYNVLDEAMIFGDLGVILPSRGSPGFGIQAGGQYNLSLIDGIIVDVAPRLSLGYTRYGGGASRIRGRR